MLLMYAAKGSAAHDSNEPYGPGYTVRIAGTICIGEQATSEVAKGMGISPDEANKAVKATPDCGNYYMPEQTLTLKKFVRIFVHYNGKKVEIWEVESPDMDKKLFVFLRNRPAPEFKQDIKA